MKTMRNLLTLALATLFCLIFAATSFASIVGTGHDLSGATGVATQNGEVCIYCHSPHVEDIDDVAGYNPLWSADVQDSTSFEPYFSSTLESALTTDPLVGPSRLCMSCHDGTIAIDSALNGTIMIGTIEARFLVGDGADLTSDHPIGFDYPTVATNDDEINVATTAYAGATIGDFLFTDGGNEIMTCATCHDVHDNSNTYFLLSTNANSALCLGCHDK